MLEGAKETLERIRSDIERAEARAAALPLLQETVGQIRERAISRQRDIAVDVDANGQLAGLDITDAALARGGRAIAADVLQLISKATLLVRERALEVTVELLGEEDPITKMTAAQLTADTAPESGTSEVRW